MLKAINIRQINQITALRTGSPFTPLAGVATVVLATICALTSIPADTAPPGALIWPAAILCFGFIIIPLLTIIIGGWWQLVRAENMSMIGIVYWLLLDLIQGLYPVEVRLVSVEKAFLAIGLFGAAILIGAVMSPWRLPRVVRDLADSDPSPQTLFSALIIAFALGMFYITYSSEFSPSIMMEAILRSRFATPWSRGALGGWEAIPEQLTYFGYLVPTLTVILGLVLQRWFNVRVLIGLMLSCVMVVFLIQSGSRRIVVVVLGAAVFTWLCSIWDRMRFRHIVQLTIGLAVLLILSNVILGNRGRGYTEVAVQSEFFNQIRVDDNFLRLAQIIEAIPAEHPFIGLEWPIYVLIRPIPRAIWANKPVGVSFSVSDFLGYRGVSLSSSVIGEWYVAFGWIGVVSGGLFFGALARAWSQLLEAPLTPMKAGVYSLGLMVLLVSLRSLIELVLLSYSLLAWLILYRLWLRRPRRVMRKA